MPKPIRCLCGSTKIFRKERGLCQNCCQTVYRRIKGVKQLLINPGKCICGSSDLTKSRGICKKCSAHLLARKRLRHKKSFYDMECLCGSTDIYNQKRLMCSNCYNIFLDISKGKRKRSQYMVLAEGKCKGCDEKLNKAVQPICQSCLGKLKKIEKVKATHRKLREKCLCGENARSVHGMCGSCHAKLCNYRSSKYKNVKCVCGSEKMFDKGRMLCKDCHTWISQSSPPAKCICGNETNFKKKRGLCNQCLSAIESRTRQHSACLCGSTKIVNKSRGLCANCQNAIYRHRRNVASRKEPPKPGSSKYLATCICGSTVISNKFRGLCKLCDKGLRYIAETSKEARKH